MRKKNMFSIGEIVKIVPPKGNKVSYLFTLSGWFLAALIPLLFIFHKLERGWDFYFLTAMSASIYCYFGIFSILSVLGQTKWRIFILLIGILLVCSPMVLSLTFYFTFFTHLYPKPIKYPIPFGISIFLECALVLISMRWFFLNKMSRRSDIK